MPQRTIQEEQLRQLRHIKAQLNPAPVVALFFGVAAAVILTVVTLFGVLVQIPARHGKPMFEGTFFRSPCYPGPGIKRDMKCR